jgi:GTP cyclohydrolase I
MENAKIEGIVKNLLEELGENPRREGLARTPKRVAKAMRYFLSGQSMDAADIINGALFDVEYDEMVIVRDIDFFSLCEHHLVPFFGKCHVAYLPGKKIIGLSKIPRILDVFARRLQVQERMTVQVAECLRDALQPKGVGVIIEAFHLCMAMRGVERQNAVTVTSSMLGAFKKRPETRAEFLKLVGRRFEGI